MEEPVTFFVVLINVAGRQRRVSHRRNRGKGIDFIQVATAGVPYSLFSFFGCNYHKRRKIEGEGKLWEKVICIIC